MKKILYLLLIVTSLPNIVYTQHIPTFLHNQEKYWWYRYTLVNDYMKVGDACGESIPAIRHYDNSCFGENNDPPSSDYGGKDIVSGAHLHFGDATTHLGNLLLMLGTEWKVLKQAKLSTRRTEYELYYALKALDRLDEEAESRSRDFEGSQDCEMVDMQSGDLNGYFIRDDVPWNFEPENHQHFNRPYVCQTVNGANGDVIQRTDENMNPDWSASVPSYVPRHPVEMSQDQVASLYLGLAIISKLVDQNVFYNGESLKELAEEAIFRIAYHCSNDFYPNETPWRIKNGVTRHLIYGTGLADWWNYLIPTLYLYKTGGAIFPSSPGVAYGLDKIDASWNSNQTTRLQAMKSSSDKHKFMYQLIQLKNWNSKHQYRGHQFLFPASFATIANNWKRPITNDNTTRSAIWKMSLKDEFRWPHLPLIYRLFHGGAMFEPQDRNAHSYQHLITLAPQCIFKNVAGNYIEKEWSSPNRLSEAFKRGGNENGDFPGISYLAMFNLYLLNEPDYGNGISNRYYVENFSHNFHNTPFFRNYTYNTLEYLSTSSRIFSGARITFRNAKVIDLLPGFNAEYGSTFTTKIKDYYCDCDGIPGGPEERHGIESTEDYDPFTMDTLFSSYIEPLEFPEPEEEQYECTQEEITEDSLFYIDALYASEDTSGIAYWNYLDSLWNEDGSTFKMVRGFSPDNSSNITTVFPNPSTNIFNIQTEYENYSISVYDNIGKLIYKKNDITSNYSFNLGNHARGLYLLQIRSNKGELLNTFKLTLE